MTEGNAIETHADDNEVISAKSVLKNTGSLFRLSFPVSLGYLLQFSLGIAEIFSLGHLGTKELAACALATMWANVSGFSLGIGMATALDTLCSQAHTGSSDRHQMGKHLQTSFVVMFFLTIFTMILWSFTEPLMVLAGQDPEISRLAAIYIYWLMPGIFPYFIYECMKRFLQCQGIMNGMLWAILIASPINIFLQWLLVWGPLPMGFIGAPIGLTITYCLLPFLMMVYILLFARKSLDSWGGWDSSAAFNSKAIIEFLRLGIPGFIMVGSEWWAFEIVALAAGWLGEEQLAAQSIVLSTSSLAYMLPMGVSIAATTRIGNALGANMPNRAKSNVYAGMLVSVCLGLMNSSFFIGVKDVWGYLFTSDPKVIGYVAAILPMAAIFQLSDGINCIGGGILRGCGHQKVGAVLNVLGYYVIGIPVGIYAAFRLNWELFGLWFGLSSALILVSLCEVVWIAKVDWKKEAILTHSRLNLENEERAALLAPGEPFLPVYDAV